MNQIETIKYSLSVNRRGTVLYVSPDETTRALAHKEFTKAGVGEPHAAECKCPSCLTIEAGDRHPDVQMIDVERFDEQMVIAYSYPSKVVTIKDVDRLSYTSQMQLLIWLEMYSNRHLIILTASGTQKLLPTILSRAFVYTEVPKLEIDIELKERAHAMLFKLMKGELNLEDPLLPEEGRPLAQALQFLMVEDLERRKRSNDTKRNYLCNNSELQTLLKLVGRYLENPKTHQLPLLLRSFQMLALQNVR